VKNRHTGVNINKITVVTSAERQKPIHRALRWPFVVYAVEVLAVNQYSVLLSDVGTPEV